MTHEQLLELIDRIDQSSLAYMDYRFESGSLELSKEVPMKVNSNEAPVASSASSTPQADSLTDVPPLAEIAPQITVAPEAEPVGPKGEAVLAPMVGVAYLRPKPDAAPFVQVGDQVTQGDTVMIIEAMKLMNEIQAPVSGRVVEILVENETVVEYNQALLIIEP
ncbi:acetyl-CoA carboxylase biotin carboxyl carrier protein [Suicoccus acidiformans]|nr:acetyl-CoA carboxylase biotin carboxyl carrier protein [Suicoccus acidiformans]